MVKQNRGQLILVGAILIALTIVASAVLLNSIHSSADLQSQQDRQALERTEGVITQIKSDIGKITVINESTEPVPYIDNTDKFEEAIEDYEQQYLNLSTRETNTLINITYRDNSTGSAVWQNDSTKDIGSTWDISDSSDPDNITYVDIMINTSQPGTFTFEPNSAANIEVDASSSSVNYGGSSCTFSSSSDNLLRITIIDGEGTITTPSGDTCLTIDYGSNFHTDSIEIDGGGLDGELYIAYKGGSSSSLPSTGYSVNSVGVQPVFTLSYQDPQVYYEGNVTIYGGIP